MQDVLNLLENVRDSGDAWEQGLGLLSPGTLLAGAIFTDILEGIRAVQQRDPFALLSKSAFDGRNTLSMEAKKCHNAHPEKLKKTSTR